MPGSFQRRRSASVHWEDDDAPTLTRTSSPPADDEESPFAARTRTFDVQAELLARITVPLRRGRLIVVIQPEPALLQAARRAAGAMGYGAVDASIEGIADFVDTWHPLAVLIEDTELAALQRELDARPASADGGRAETPVLCVSRRAVSHPNFTQRLTRVLWDRAKSLRDRPPPAVAAAETSALGKVAV
jgi:hypothetical protein